MRLFTVRPKRFWWFHKIFRTNTWKACKIAEAHIAEQIKKPRLRLVDLVPELASPYGWVDEGPAKETAIH